MLNGNFACKFFITFGAGPSLSVLLPPELLLMILKHLSATDIMALASTCRRFWAICSSDSVWRELFAEVFQIRDSSVLSHLSANPTHESDWMAMSIQSANQEPDSQTSLSSSVLSWRREFFKVSVFRSLTRAPNLTLFKDGQSIDC
jgi:hypothetical protein